MKPEQNKPVVVYAVRHTENDADSEMVVCESFVEFHQYPHSPVVRILADNCIGLGDVDAAISGLRASADLLERLTPAIFGVSKPAKKRAAIQTVELGVSKKSPVRKKRTRPNVPIGGPADKLKKVIDDEKRKIRRGRPKGSKNAKPAQAASKASKSK